jgi:hypothetical protein
MKITHAPPTRLRLTDPVDMAERLWPGAPNSARSAVDILLVERPNEPDSLSISRPCAQRRKRVPEGTVLRNQFPRKKLPPFRSGHTADKRYLEKFDLQEVEIERFQKEIDRLRALEFKQKKELEDYLANLKLK